MVADKLAAAKVPVLTGAMNNIPAASPRSARGRRTRRCCAKAGVQVGAHRQRRRRRRGGVQRPQHALRGGQRGRLRHGVGRRAARDHARAGRDVRRRGPGRLARSRARTANVVIWSGDPFEFATRAGARLRARPRSRRPVASGHAEQRYKTLPPDYIGRRRRERDVEQRDASAPRGHGHGRRTRRSDGSVSRRVERSASRRALLASCR